MASENKILDYLTKKLVVEQTLVTFRSLSRDLEIHVNKAKNELAKYHAEHQFSEVAHATYWISGETNMKADNGMDIDEDEEGEEVTETTVMLVEESDLEEAKEGFLSINAIHVYSLSPAPLRESALVCEPTIHLRKVEAEKGQQLAKLVGRISGSHVKRRSGLGKTKTLGPAVASTSKAKAPRLAKAATVKEVKDEKKDISKSEAKPDSKEDKPKAKATGKINFEKAKPKESKVEEKKPKAVPKLAVAESSSKAHKVGDKKEEPKRGVKRKNTVRVSDSESEDNASPPSPAPQVKVGPPKRKPTAQKAAVQPKRSVIVSDDEVSDVPVRPRVKGKAKAVVVDSESDTELKAMMDLDDDQVIKVSRSASEARKRKSDEDVEMEDVQETEPEPVIKSKAKKATKKKVIPVVTEDYSSYESADEEEPEPEPVKGKGKRKSTAAEKKADNGEAKTTSKPPSDAAEPKPKQKKAAKSTGQMDLKSWFAKPAKK
ncbi:hypothetical protein EVG20_g2816 [Dentipellis fragilis]|uniref:DNA polymerase delta subunit 3 n=1 Tax=Dentipellis fragilis TaxID=205917 RepID=A0A4Y9Z9W5_9AGAM|nr:hypothetical protein EVG20_g2816 [Dentipellis fragilis]